MMAELLEAIRHGSVEQVKRIMTPSNVNVPLFSGRSPLSLACEHGNLEITKILLDGGANVRVKDHHWFTPLHWALTFNPSKEVASPCQAGSVAEIVQLLVQRGADVNAYDIDGATPLHVAACHGQSQGVKILLAAGADPTQPAIRYRRLPLHDAAMGEDVKVIDVFIEHGINVDIRDAHNATPLSLACEIGANSEVDGALLDWGADPSLTVAWGETALDRAERYECEVDPFERHVIKMKAANLLDDETLRGLPLAERSNQQNDFEQQCAAEISRLKAKFIGKTTFKYYDLLIKKSSALLNPDIKDILFEDNHRLSFPIYGRVIDRQVKLGLERLKLLSKCAEILQRSSDLIHHLPLELIYLICAYLDDLTLKAVIEISSLKPQASVATSGPSCNNVPAMDRLEAEMNFLEMPGVGNRT